MQITVKEILQFLLERKYILSFLLQALQFICLPQRAAGKQNQHQNYCQRNDSIQKDQLRSIPVHILIYALGFIPDLLLFHLSQRNQHT